MSHRGPFPKLHGTAGKGRAKGSRNKRTMAALALAQIGDTPVEFGLRVMRDDEQPMDIRLHGARIAAPYIHPKPHPMGETVHLDLPDTNTADGITRASAELLRAVSKGEISVTVARDLVAIMDGHRRNLELSDIDSRLKALEAAHGRGN